jgi:hypothetical protein
MNTLDQDRYWMHRALELARRVAPVPVIFSTQQR